MVRKIVLEATQQPKMENFILIMECVGTMRTLEKEQEGLSGRRFNIEQELRKYSISCHNASNCSDVGINCFRCKSNSSRRSYFRDLLERGVDIRAGGWAASASLYEADTSGQ